MIVCRADFRVGAENQAKPRVYKQERWWRSRIEDFGSLLRTYNPSHLTVKEDRLRLVTESTPPLHRCWSVILLVCKIVGPPRHCSRRWKAKIVPFSRDERFVIPATGSFIGHFNVIGALGNSYDETPESPESSADRMGRLHLLASAHAVRAKGLGSMSDLTMTI
jgi:hypothetical protein